MPLAARSRRTLHRLRRALVPALLAFAAQPAAAQVPDDVHWLGVANLTGPLRNGPTASAMDAGGRIYAGGTMALGFDLVARVARWDGTAWTTLGDRFESYAAVAALAVHPAGDVYAAGTFQRVFNGGGAPVESANVARWNDAAGAWEGLGRGTQGSVAHLALDAAGDVYVAGANTGVNANGDEVPFTALGRWNAALRTWEAVGSGSLPTVGGFARDAAGGLVVAGDLATIRNADGSLLAAGNLIRWDGSRWDRVGGGLEPAPGHAALGAVSLLAAPGGDLFAAGPLRAVDAGGTRVAGPVVRWDGSRWHTACRNAPGDAAGHLGLDGAGNVYALFAGRTALAVCPSPGSATTDWVPIARFDGVLSVPASFPETVAAHPGFAGPHLYAGGTFQRLFDPQAGAQPLARDAWWDGVRWRQLLPSGHTLNGAVYATVTDNRVVVAGGEFSVFNHTPARRLVANTGTGWEPLGGGVDGSVLALVLRPAGPWNHLYAGGLFTAAADADGTVVPAAHVARFDFQRRTWAPLGGGVDGPVYALAELTLFDVLSGVETAHLYVGGDFTTASNADGSTVAARGIVRWNVRTERWESVGAVDGVVRALQLSYPSFETGPPGVQGYDLYVGGAFSTVTHPDGSPVAAANVARRSSYREAWEPLGDGVDGEVRALWMERRPYRADPTRPVLYVGGHFGHATNPNEPPLNTRFLARWDPGNGWRRIGNGVNGPVHAIRDHVVAGDFTSAQSSRSTITPVHHIARMVDGFEQWFEPLGSGTNGPVEALAHVTCLLPPPDVDVGSTLFVGGSFTTAGTHWAPFLARWRYRHPPAPSKQVVIVIPNDGYCQTHTCTGAVDFGIPRGCTPLWHATKQQTDHEVVVPGLRAGGRAVVGLPPGVPFSLTLAQDDAPGLPVASFRDLVLRAEQPHLLLLAGLADPGAYAPNPEGRPTAVAPVLVPLPVEEPGAPPDGAANVLFVHAATDAPTVDFAVQGSGVTVEAVPYGEAGAPVRLPAGRHLVEVRRSRDGALLGTFEADLGGAEALATVLLTGFVDPAANRDGAPLGLRVLDEGALPVALVSFDALRDGPDVLLRWATAGETNNAGFEVEYASVAAGAWQRLAFVPGHGTTTAPQRYEHRVAGLAPGTYRFRLRQVDHDGRFDYGPAVEVRVDGPNGFALSAVHPNPFDTEARITFDVPERAHVTLVAFDVLGRAVRRLVDGVREAGRHTVSLSGAGLAAGPYVLRMQAAGRVTYRTVVRLR